MPYANRVPLHKAHPQEKGMFLWLGGTCSTVGKEARGPGSQPSFVKGSVGCSCLFLKPQTPREGAEGGRESGRVGGRVGERAGGWGESGRVGWRASEQAVRGNISTDLNLSIAPVLKDPRLVRINLRVPSGPR